MGKDILKQYPELEKLSKNDNHLWINPGLKSVNEILTSLSVSKDDVIKADLKLKKFAPLLEKLFPELRKSSGIIESELLEVDNFKDKFFSDFESRIFIKGDHALPVAGSVKARGGIYEVLLFAEKTALKSGLFNEGDDYLRLLDNDIRKYFSDFTVSVGSTGNLGLSIGITASALGFSSKVHMSVEAKEWKKKKLRDRGVDVVEHVSDYSKAVSEGRKAAGENPEEYFVDDENSLPLFLGYSVAAIRLKEQLIEKNIPVDSYNPLFVYLPCGVGGAPCGIAFGLKQVFGDDVYCFLAEPSQAPCMMMGLITDFKEKISIYDIGLKNQTCADGLAVSTPSLLAGNLVKNLLAGSFTIDDNSLCKDLTILYKTEGIAVEPSAAAGFRGPLMLSEYGGKNFDLKNVVKKANATHILWTTGGIFVPDQEFKNYLK